MDRIQVHKDLSAIVVLNGYGMELTRYIKRSDSLQCLQGGYEDIPMKEGILRNPYSEHSKKYETVRDIINVYNSIEGGLKDSEPSFSFY